jgi:predicted dehydrogenase
VRRLLERQSLLERKGQADVGLVPASSLRRGGPAAFRLFQNGIDFSEMKVGIIGCGKIADDHASAIQAVGDAEIVGVCDREELMAKQLAERFDVAHHFADARAMLRTCRPQVVHITTPPQGHFALGKLCIEEGCSAFIEKPFTVTADEAYELVTLAEARGLKLTVGHNHQFSHAATEMRQLIQKGFLGGPPVHMESVFCYRMDDERYAKALLSDKKHWVRTLPGKLLHNVISHGVCKIAEFLSSDSPEVSAAGFSSPLLVRIGEHQIVDELRVMIREERGTTAYFTFSSQMGPGLHQFRVFGPSNSLWVDYTQQWVVKMKKSGFRSYLNQFAPPLEFGKQHLCNGLRNMTKFMYNRFHEDTGRRRLIGLFYESIRKGGPVPIPYREIVLTSRIMDQIFLQVPQV